MSSPYMSPIPDRSTESDRGKVVLQGAVIILAVALVLVISWQKRVDAYYQNRLQAVEASAAIGRIVVEDQLALQQYLLSGDPRLVDKVGQNGKSLEERLNSFPVAHSVETKDCIQRLRTLHKQWSEQFATPLIVRREQLDAGHGTLADLQIEFLQRDPQRWSRDFADELEAFTRAVTSTEPPSILPISTKQ